MQITVGQALKMARDHHKAGRIAEAEAVCRKLLSRVPDQPDALHLLGYLTAGRSPKEGADMIRRAIEINPKNADFHNNLGCVLFADKRHDEAIAAWRNAVSIRPKYTDAYNNLASALIEQGDANQAIEACKHATESDPNSPRAWFILGNALRASHRCDEAENAYRRAIALKPDFGECLTNLGMALRDQGRFDDARSIFHRAIAMKPNSANDHWNYALTLLRAGDYENGFMEYEWRWNWEGFPDKRQTYPQPQWCGSDLAGKTIFVHAEQGFGDLIQMARYVPLLAQRGARVIVGCQPEMRRLMSTLKGSPQVRVTGEPIGPFDLHIPAMSLPLAFETTVDTVPGDVPYLCADDVLVDSWAHRMKTMSEVPSASSNSSFGQAGETPRWGGHSCPPESASGGILAPRADSNRFGEGKNALPLIDSRQARMPAPPDSSALSVAKPSQVFRVGLVWAGQPKHGDDRRRSLTLAALAPLARVDRARFFSLQKGPAAEQIASPPPGLRLTALGADLKDFADTAAVIASLDLVITVDTAVAHLAGAMGKRCWVLLASVPDWRWMLNRDDSPWYPTARLFRQEAGQAWEPVIERVAQRLACDDMPGGAFSPRDRDTGVPPVRLVAD